MLSYIFKESVNSLLFFCEFLCLHVFHLGHEYSRKHSRIFIFSFSSSISGRNSKIFINIIGSKQKGNNHKYNSETIQRIKKSNTNYSIHTGYQESKVCTQEVMKNMHPSILSSFVNIHKPTCSNFFSNIRIRSNKRRQVGVSCECINRYIDIYPSPVNYVNFKKNIS